MAQSLFDDLMKSLQSYVTDKKQLKLVESAYNFAKEKHQGQYRKSGEDYISHPVNVAIILSEYHIDPTTIMAGILHDVLEDTISTREEIVELFGEEVAYLIDGVTKLGKYKYKQGHSTEEEKILAQAKNYQKLLASMANDIRVILIKLADRLHNIRTLSSLNEEKQKRIAKETMDIYAPLAHRLGMYVMKAELEDTSFKYLQPHTYNRIARLIADTRVNRERDLNRMNENLKNLLTQHQINCNIKGRIKNIYSVYKKMVMRNKDFEEIFDLLALRVIVKNVESCYQTVGIIHSRYTPIPNRFKDYIAMPKPNLYQSLHTSVVSSGKVYEIQIRTPEMDEIAEFGVAAHWAYKENLSSRKINTLAKQKLRWFDDLVNFKNESDNAEDLVHVLRDDILHSNVYVFTPEGDIIDLPAGSTPLDFAFRIHTQVGIQTVGAIVNEKIVPLDYKLQTGDIVSIKTSANSFGPNDNWLKIVKTSNAKSKIRSFLNKKRKDLLLDIGREDFQKEISQRGITLKLTDKEIEKALGKKGIRSVEDLYYEIGKNTISPGSAVNSLLEKEGFTEEDLIQRINESNFYKTTGNTNIIVEGLKTPSVKLSNCCTPIPGDAITGYVSKGTGIAVHRSECNNLKSMDSNRLIKVRWGKDDSIQYEVNIKIVVQNRDNVLAEIINNITSNKGKVLQVAASTNSRLEGVIKLKIGIHNRIELEKIIRSLEIVPDVFSIERMMK